MNAAIIACLKITLDDVKPTVLRRLEAPFSIRLDRLHLALQAAIGWTDSHLYEIRIDNMGWGLPDLGWSGGPLDASKAHLDKVIEDVGRKTFVYLYDFGDGWSHTIKIERLTNAIPGLVYPRLIEASGHCPPEDIGGPAGYADFMEAIADPNAGGRYRTRKSWSRCRWILRLQSPRLLTPPDFTSVSCFGGARSCVIGFRQRHQR